MTPERWQQLKQIFQSALERNPAERSAFLNQACADDPPLRNEVELLIPAHDQAGDSIEAMAAEAATEMLDDDQAGSIVGKQISHYQVVSRIGRGGMGEVFLAHDTSLGRKVALKLLRSDFTRNEERLRRFQQEARAASALNHPNILTIHEIGQDGSLHFMATEYVEGETLRQRLSRARITVGQTLDVAVQVASALAAAHQAGIIHRDIKPENIMVRSNGNVKVLDFGLAKLTEPKTIDTAAPTLPQVETAPGVVMGTFSYMSPEQARGLAVDTRTDIWSLGVMIYEMAAGRQPFEGETASDVMSLILQKEPPPLVYSWPEVPAELERIVRKALRKDREERYQTIKDLLIDLRNLRKELELEVEMERSAPPISARAMSSGQSAAATAHSASSAEYIVTEIKQHKRGLAVALAAMILLSVAGIAYYFGRGGKTAIDSIAVLPLVNTGGDPNTEYLSDGISEALINSLTELQQLKVIARTTAFRYKGKEIDPQAVGRQLNVRAVLTGRVRQTGEMLDIQVDLVDATTGAQLWGQEYDRKFSDLVTVKQDIAREVTEKLRLRLSGAEQQQLARRDTANPEAYQLYLKGRFYWNKRTVESLKKSIEYFNQAIEKDPSYALAYSGLADAYGLFSTYSVSSPQESYPKAKAAAKKALELDETLAEAHTSLAKVLHYDWNLAESNREFQRAIELNPNYATAHQWYGNGNLRFMGRFDEAIAEMKRAQELDPLSLVINSDVGVTYISARQYGQAIEQLRKTTEMDQGFYYAHWNLGIAYEMKGSLQEALAEYQKARQLTDDPRMLALLGHGLAVSGKRDEALRMLDQLKEMAKQRYVPAYSFTIVYVGLGEKDQALQWLEREYQD